MTRTKLNIEQAYVVLNADKKASVEVVDTNLFQRLDANYSGFQGCELISCFEFEQNWSSWEMHPAGDETVILLSGQVTFALQYDKAEELVQLKKPGDFMLVPKNIWHTARCTVKTKLLFITPGEGTQHKAL